MRYKPVLIDSIAALDSVRFAILTLRLLVPLEIPNVVTEGITNQADLYFDDLRCLCMSDC
jgi:hypothetical protein